MGADLIWIKAGIAALTPASVDLPPDIERTMLPHATFIAKPLSAHDVAEDRAAMRRAFALVNLAHPRLTFEGWICFLKRAMRPSPSKSGVVFLEDPRGYPHAVFRYAVDDRTSLASSRSRRLTRTLRLSDLVAADVGSQSQLATVARFGERLAGELNCKSLTIELPGLARADALGLKEYEVAAGGILFRELVPAAPLRAVRAGAV